MPKKFTIVTGLRKVRSEMPITLIRFVVLATAYDTAVSLCIKKNAHKFWKNENKLESINNKTKLTSGNDVEYS